MAVQPFGMDAEVIRMNAVATRARRQDGGDRGLTLLETMIAIVILLVGIIAVLNLFTFAVSRGKVLGEIGSLTTSYSEAKMEQLLPLAFSDSATDTTKSPPATSGGTGLCGAMAANSSCGSVHPAATVAGYVDYLDYNGTLLTSSTGAAFVVQWSITTGSDANVKTIAVSASAARIGVGNGSLPYTVLTTVKTNY